jgi:DNA (cytosine-5)-methyltransferase 1
MAIRRWEIILGRAAPPPTCPGRTGTPVLAPAFVEWMMGTPHGWTDDLGLSRNARLRLCGNAVVPQQASLAMHLLLRQLADRRTLL